MLKVLALGAHPDDIEFGCGATLIKLFALGAHISLWIATYGEVGASNKIRKAEAESSASFMGTNGIFWGGYPDTLIPHSKEIITKIEQVLKEVEPDIIFVHYYEDTHQDHVNLSLSTITATRYSKNVLFYEVPTTSTAFSPDIFVDIKDVLDKKLNLLKTHASQIDKVKIGILDILEVARSTANFRGIQARVEYAEGFQAYRLQFLDILKLWQK